MTVFSDKYRKKEASTTLGSRYRKDASGVGSVNRTTQNSSGSTNLLMFNKGFTSSPPPPPKEKGFFSTVFGAAKNYLKSYRAVDDILQKRENTLTEPITQPLLDNTFNTKIGRSVAHHVSSWTSDLPLKYLAFVESLSTDIAYRDAFKSLKITSQSGTPGITQRFANTLLSSGPQSAIGVALSFAPVAGKPLSMAYWAAISADEQIKSKGKVTSLTPIAIDVFGDKMLGDALTTILRTSKSTLMRIFKGAVVEGGTEVGQTLAKLGNDHRNATSDEERAEIFAKLKQYITSGDILVEFSAGAGAGSGITAVAGSLPPLPPIPGSVAGAAGLTIEQVRPKPPVAPQTAPGREIAPQTSARLSPADPLLSEARKYKSAEEFVATNQKTLYRGATSNEVGSIPKEGLSVSLDPGVAKKYAKARGLSGFTDKQYISSDAKVIKLEDVPNSIRAAEEGSDFAGKAAIWARKQGYDVLDMTKGNEAEMRILNNNALITREQQSSQLNSIWQQANKGVIDERLVSLADKDGMVTMYRAAPKFPTDTFAKDTHFATSPKSARYYAESHYAGDPQDITVRSVQVPASKLKRGGSADSWQLKEDYPVGEQAQKDVKPKEAPVKEPKAPKPPKKTKGVRREGIEPSTSEVSARRSATELPANDSIVPPSKSDVKSGLASRVYERMRAEHPELGDDVLYDPITLKEQAERAVALIETDKQRAFDIAMGTEVSSDLTQTAANIALVEKAWQDGNDDLAQRLLTKRTLDQTRRGQEIVSERGSIADNSTSRYVKELLASRLDKLGKSYLGTLKDTVKRQSDKGKAMAVIEEQVAEVKEKIQNKKLKMDDALTLLDKLACL